jgi:hypothetical protein
MKITINVDCTPEEARLFMGLPDVVPLQESMLAHMKTQMEKTAAAMDPETIMKTLFPHAENLAELQRSFWSQLTGAANR